ncbi:MAG: toll/interleukin-1 receptor domain-containing protein [Anaerolineae bacterium]|nr:toll/interleukin-1 receptor domain-containing protein [Anaerolineae bacterium]
MAKFFISYSRSVKDEVHEILDLLRANGHEVWWDGDIPVIADWWATILEHIEWCEVFIFVVSEKSVQSAYCLAELRYANDRQRPILPFILSDSATLTLPSEIPSRAQRLSYSGNSKEMLGQINMAYASIDWNLHKDIRVRRPSEPLTGDDNLVKQFQKARRLASNQEYEEAKRLFQNVKALDYEEWGKECDEWLARLTSYTFIIDLVKDESTLKRAEQAWQTHVQAYGSSFDPYNIKKKLRKKYIRWGIVLLLLIVAITAGAMVLFNQNAGVTMNTSTHESTLALTGTEKSISDSQTATMSIFAPTLTARARQVSRSSTPRSTVTYTPTQPPLTDTQAPGATNTPSATATAIPMIPLTQTKHADETAAAIQ